MAEETIRRNEVYEQIVQLSFVLEELAQLFGPDAKAWRVARTDANKVETVTNNINVLLDYYGRGED